MASADLEGEAPHGCAEGGIARATVRPPPARWRRRLFPHVVRRALLGAWLATGAIAGTALVLGRWIAPPPAAAAGAVGPRATSRGGPPSARSSSSPSAAPWFTLHVLYASCRCSENIFAHLFQRGPIPGTRERIVLVAGRRDDPMADRYRARATAAGFAVETVTPEDLARRFGLEAAPLLVVADPTGRIRYAGGYTDHDRGKRQLAVGDEADETIVADLMADRGSVDPPLLAAALGRRLQDALAPAPSPDGPQGP